MDFSLSQEQELLQETVRGLVTRECPASRVRQVFDGESGVDDVLWSSLAQMGVCGLLVPERHGGAGLGMLELALVSEELGRGAAPTPLFGHSLASLGILLGGSAAQQAAWLPPLAAAEKRVGLALGEPDGAWRPECWTPALEGTHLSGVKDFVLDAPQADVLLVGCAGGRLALVDTGSVGVEIELANSLDRGRRHARVRFEKARAEPLAEEASPAERLLDAGCILLAAEAYGAASQLVRMSAAYANAREQFGQPISQFQGIKHQLANMALAVEPSRGLWWFAGHVFEHAPEEAPRAAALAKAHITECATQVARDATEIHGGIGMTWECDVQIWFKRILFARHFLGTPEAHRARVALLGAW